MADIASTLTPLFIQHVQAAVLQAGAFIRAERLRFTPEHIEVKGRNDLVSYVDREAERILHDAFERLLPGSGYIMEESGIQHAEKDAVWIVDPLDGTTNFIFGVPVFSVSVALQLKGQVVLGIVYEVNRDELFLATLGGGATLNGKSIVVNKTAELNECLIATGFPFRTFNNVEEYMLMLRDFMQNTRGIRRLGSAAIDLAYTAMGRFDGFFEVNLSAWDVAAGALIVQEAGGRVTDFYGNTNYVHGRSIVATNGHIHKGMLRLIGEHANVVR